MVEEIAKGLFRKEFMGVHMHLLVFFVVRSPVSLEHTC